MRTIDAERLLKIGKIIFIGGCALGAYGNHGGGRY
jgi:hypothetical protein